MEKYIDFIIEEDKFAAHNGMQLVECRPGYAKAILKVSSIHLNAAGVVHGGTLFGLADFAAAAVNAYGVVALSINNSISYFGKWRSGVITAEVVEIDRSHKLTTCDVNITDDTGKLLSSFRGTSYITKRVITDI